MKERRKEARLRRARLAVQEAVAEAEESGPDILTAVTLSVVNGPRELEFKPIS